MFYYFGYGSNLSLNALRAKGVTPRSSEPAVLEGWQLLFDVPDFFAHEGGNGNVERRAGASVHGVLHGCEDHELADLDRMEALGVVYERVQVATRTYTGRVERAELYTARPERRDASLRPSQRYLNILVHGAQSMQLDPTYVDRLRRVPVRPPAHYPPFEPPSEGRDFTRAALERTPEHVVLCGLVFDMRGARAEHAYLRELLAGVDATALLLKRMDTATGEESDESIDLATLSDAQREHLNPYLHEFAREYRFAGRVVD